MGCQHQGNTPPITYSLLVYYGLYPSSREVNYWYSAVHDNLL